MYIYIYIIIIIIIIIIIYFPTCDLNMSFVWPAV